MLPAYKGFFFGEGSPRGTHFEVLRSGTFPRWPALAGRTLSETLQAGCPLVSAAHGRPRIRRGPGPGSIHQGLPLTPFVSRRFEVFDLALLHHAQPLLQRNQG